MARPRPTRKVQNPPTHEPSTTRSPLGEEFADSTDFEHQVDYFYHEEDHGFIIDGWLLDPEQEIASFHLTDGSVFSEDLMKTAIRRARPDVMTALSVDEPDNLLGFLHSVELEDFPVDPNTDMSLCFMLNDGESYEVPVQRERPSEYWHTRFLGMLQGDSVIPAESGTALSETSDPFTGHDQLRDFIRIGIDSCYAIGGEQLFLTGWILDEHRSIRSLKVLRGRQVSSDIRSQATIYPRPDLEEVFKPHLKGGSHEFGFSALVDLAGKTSTLVPADAKLVGRTIHGERFQMPLDNIATDDDFQAMSAKLFSEFSKSSFGAGARVAAVGHALRSSISQRKSKEKPGFKIFQKNYGEEVAQPEISVIVPLFGRFDFVEYQLSQFALDPDFQKTELIYLIDDPRIFDSVRMISQDLYDIFRVPFRLLSSGQNLGFAGANNFAVQRSRGEMVLLLNSDVMPRRPGWLSALRQTYASLPDAGAITPVLVFEDGSVQHRGIQFDRHPDYPDELWLNRHPLKGLPTSLIEVREKPEPFPAVTAACMMISRKKYDELEGLDEAYIFGDFEDSDFCLKALAKGYQNYLIPNISLYHLERKSQSLFEDSNWKDNISLFNCWQHTERWGKTILSLIEAQRDTEDKKQ